MKKFPKIVAALLLLLPLAVAQETRPDEQTRVYQENGKWSRQITGSLAAAKNLRVKVESGVGAGRGRFAADHQLCPSAIIPTLRRKRRPGANSKSYKISVYVRGDTAWVVGEWQGSRPRRSSSEFVINVPRNTDLVKVETDGGDLTATGIAGRVEA